PRWYSIGNAGAITLSDARKLASKILYQVAEGADPHADRLALRGRGSFEQVAQRYVEEHARKRNKSWRQADALVARCLLPRWAKLDIGNIRRGDVKAAMAAITAPVLANQVLAAASAVFSWAVGRTSSLRIRAPGWRRMTRPVASARSVTPRLPRSGPISAPH